MPAEPYPEVSPSPSFPELERRVIERWRAAGTFQASIERRRAEGADEFVFYDGPPFANGPMHYGHLLTGFIKDAVPRYRTMRGQTVERRFGWDCHGLPIEMEAEKALGVSGRVAINDYGVDRFNEYCRSIVGSTADEWNGKVQRQARWVDMVNDYKTMDLTFMESVMWAIKQLWEKGLLYEGVRVLPYCWECETPLSNFETRLDDAYRQRQDPALTVWFELETGERVLVWTTTPWTLPSNLALAVGPDIPYAVFAEGDQRYVLGEATVAHYARELEGLERVGTVLGRELVGRAYTPLFGFFASTPNAFRVLAADWVETEEGTGVVHLAPGFGEVDLATCEAAGIPVVCPVDDHGRFTREVPDWAGQQVFDANTGIIRALKDAGHVVRHETYDHAYPHCWRTDTPLIYKAVSSWFVKVTAIRDRMLELNQQITWVPDHVRDGSFGKWLEGARDWSISRNRFWGSPIPVWKSDNPEYPRVDVYGSLDELERDFGVRPTDLHRPAIDELVRPNPDDPTGRSMMRRVEDVLDCWFESGSMPYAQVHYPFENAEWFESHFPGDFICEYIGQTRGWFYTLHVLATALFDRPAFDTCVVHGVLLGDDGQKLSKRLKNYPDPDDVFDHIGSDAMRWSLLSSAAVRGGDMIADRRQMEEAVRQVLLPIWNAWYFLTLYARAEGVRGREAAVDPSMHVLDRYALAKARQLVERVTVRMDAYDISGACAEVVAYLDSLNNWYIRRSRARFYAGDQAAVDTLHTVLEVLCRVAAPLLPLLTDTIWPALTGGESVHLTDWPDAGAMYDEPELVAAMDAVRDVCSAALSVRKAEGLRVRLPLASLVVGAADVDALRPFADVIADEVNVKRVELTTEVAAERVLRLNPRVLGPRVGADVQKLLRAAKEGDYELDGDDVVVLGRRLEPDEYELVLQGGGPGTRVVPGSSTVVTLDLHVTPELEAEGIARDVVRGVNEARRAAGLDVSDRIRLTVDCGDHDDVRAALRTHEPYVLAETLAVELVLPDDGRRVPSEGHRVELADGRAVRVAVATT